MSFMYVIYDWANHVMQTEKRTLHVVSIGDSPHEREALFKVYEQLPIRFVPKSVKMMERPSISDLIAQHDLIQSDLGKYMSCQVGCDLTVRGNQLHPTKLNYAESDKNIDICLREPSSTRSRSVRAPPCKAPRL
jgi:hypothetical protein